MLAFNEADKIADSLASARACPWCDELLVFDSGSTDDTVAIAERYADRVEHHDWVDFTTNRRLLTDSATNDWIFLLDADEQVTPELANEIAALTNTKFKNHPVMTMPRRNYLLGKHVRAWDPDRINRLFDRRRVTWPERSIHDTRIPTEGTENRLSNPILHNANVSYFTDYFDGPRYAKRAEALAREMYDQGRRVGFVGLWLRPWVAFIKFYFLKRGFIDGTFGLMIAQKAAFSVQLKYAYLWYLQQNEEKGE